MWLSWSSLTRKKWNFYYLRLHTACSYDTCVLDLITHTDNSNKNSVTAKQILVKCYLKKI